MECSTNVAMRAGIIGFDTESHPIGSGRGVVLALLMECSAKVAVSLGIIRLDPQRFAIRRDIRSASRYAATASSSLPKWKSAVPRLRWPFAPQVPSG